MSAPSTSSLWLADPPLGPDVGRRLYEIVRAHRPRHVFEIGTVYGGSARIIAQAMVDAGCAPSPQRLFLVGAAPRLLPEHEAYLSGKSTLVVGALPQALDLLPWVEGGFDAVFVDGPRGEEAQGRLLKAIRPRIAERAIVLWRDAGTLGVKAAARARALGYEDQAVVAGLHLLRPAS